MIFAVGYAAGINGSIKLRLQDGNSDSEGRVEVFDGQEWGTVCDDFWAFNAATAVCQFLG